MIDDRAKCVTDQWDGNDMQWTMPQCAGKDAHSRTTVRYECYVTW
jgi:hypothetical protein